METAQQVAELLDQAATDIGLYGWKNCGAGEFDGMPHGTYPRCLWIGIVRAAEKRRELDLDSCLTDAENELLAHFAVERLSDVFLINDRHPEADGQRWAVETLRAIAQKVRTAGVQKSDAVPASS